MYTKLQELKLFLNNTSLTKEAREVHGMVRQEELTKETYETIHRINKRMIQVFPRGENEIPSKVFSKKFFNYILKNNPDILKYVKKGKLKEDLNEFASKEMYNISHYFRDNFIHNFYIPFILEIFKKNFSDFPDIIEWTSVSMGEKFGRNDWNDFDVDGANIGRYMQDLFHDMHHAITHPVAYKKFVEQGFNISNYNFLDIIEETLISSIDIVYNKEFSGTKASVLSESIGWGQLDRLLKERYGFAMPLSPESKDSMLLTIDKEAAEGDRNNDTLLEDKIAFAKAIINEAFNTKAVSLVPVAKKIWKTFIFKNNESFLTTEKEETFIRFLKDVDNAMPELEAAFNKVYDNCIKFYSNLFFRKKLKELKNEKTI